MRPCPRIRLPPVKVLVIGSGAREHALVRALMLDPSVDAVIAAPGNPGIDAIALCRELPQGVLDVAGVAALAAALGVDLVVVGPEAPLVAGVADAVRKRGIACFGPSAQAARLEGSKAFAKEVMAAAGVPTALAHVCTTVDEVVGALDALGAPYVVKDDGLAAGKGVVVISSEMPELLGLCDRICVMNEGRFVAEMPVAEASQEAIMRAILRNRDVKLVSTGPDDVHATPSL